MSKKNFLVSLITILWVVSGLFCFCHEEIAVESHECSPAACTHGPSEPLKGDPNDCSFCCGHMVSTAEFFVETFDLPPQENISVDILMSSEQLNFHFIYHPPKA